MTSTNTKIENTKKCKHKSTSTKNKNQKPKTKTQKSKHKNHRHICNTCDTYENDYNEALGTRWVKNCFTSWTTLL